jgi:heat shock protein HtpX
VLIGLAFVALISGAVCAGRLVAGVGGAVIAGTSMLLAGVSLYLGASACVLRLAGAYPLRRADAPAVCRLVEQLAAQCGLPGAPRLYWLPGDAPNALATGRNPAHAALAVTPTLLAFLERDELAGVLTRELTCIARRYTATGDMAAALAGGLLWISYQQGRSRGDVVADDPPVRRSKTWGDTGMRSALTTIAARLVCATGAAAQVYAADAEGAALFGDPFPIARALAKLTVANSTPPVWRANPGLACQFVVAPYIEKPLRPLFTTPPPLNARVQSLTRQALRPAVNPGGTLGRPGSIGR